MTQTFRAGQKSKSPTTSSPVQTSQFASRPFTEPVQQKAQQPNLQTILQRAERAGNPISEKSIQKQEESIPNQTGLPDNLKAGIENLSGYSLDNVRVHYNSPKPAQLQALAYTQGTEIHVAPGQEEHLPHEAWHVVQQMQGRVKPTMQMKGVQINDDEGLEREADVMGAKAQTDFIQSILSQQDPSPSPLASGNISGGVIQGLFKKVALESLVETQYAGHNVYIDEETNEIYVYQSSTSDGSKIFLANQKHTVVIDSSGNLLEKHDVTSRKKDKVESADDPMGEINVMEYPFYPLEDAERNLREENINPSKLTTALSSQIVLTPFVQGTLGTAASDIYEYKYSPNQIWVSSIQIGDKDRPETRFENQESHTVAWTLVRNGLMGLAGQSLTDFLNYLAKEFQEIEPFVQMLEGKSLLAATTGFNILGTMLSGNLPIDIWQKLTSQLLIQYLQIYQLSSSATYKRGKAKGHGESHAMEQLKQDEEAITNNQIPRPASKVALDAAKMLDVQFRVDSLGVQEYAYVVYHWLKMLEHTFPNLMNFYREQIFNLIGEKQIANSFKDELDIDRSDSFTVKELIEKYEYNTLSPIPKKELELKQLDIPKSISSLLSTNFVANIGIEPHTQGHYQKRIIYQDITINDIFYFYRYLSIGHIQISDQDRPKTKFLKHQKSHTVPWTLTRNAIKSFKGKALGTLLQYLYERFQELEIDIKIPEGITIAKEGIALIKIYEQQMLPIDQWQVIASELVRKYFIAYQVAESTSYVNPQEAERALGHGEGSNMAVLRKNEYFIENFGNISDSKDRILEAIYGMFDAQVTSTLSEQNIKQAFCGMKDKLMLTFPHISEYFWKDAIANMEKTKIGMRTLKEILDDASISIDRSAFKSL